MKKKLDLSIDLSLEQRFQKEFVVKNKDSILLDVKIFNDRKPVSLEGNVIRLYIKKSDDTFVVQGGTDELGDNSIVISGNRLLINVKNSATNVSGLCYGEIEIEDDEGTIATNSFVFEVVDRIGNIDKAIQSVDDIYILGEIEKFIIQAKIDMALLKEQIAEGLVKINEFNEFVIEKTEELQSAIDKALDDITANSEAYLSKITGLSEEYGLKIERLSEEFLLSISLKADEVIETIRNERENSISIIEDTTSEGSLYIRQIAENEKLEIERKANEKIAEIEIKTTEVVEAIDTKTEESIDIINTAKVDAINKIQEVEAGADIKIENLNNLITVSEEILATFDTSKSEASEIRDALTALIETSNSLKANLEAENNKATSNINELNTLHPEADLKIEELRDLIQQAIDIAIPALKDYIAEFAPAVDLTEVNEKLEELYNAINTINTQFNNYYTKEEIDVLIKDKTGTIAGSLLPAPYSTEPENPFGDECYITVRAKDKNGVYHIGYGKYYNDNYPAYLSNNNCIYLSNASANVAIYKYTETDKTWTAVANRTFVIAKSPIDVYTNNIDIKYHSNDPNKGQIWKEAFVLSGEEPEIDFNMAIEYKRYNINITAEDEIFNSPVIGALKGVLTVDKASNNIIQTVITDQNKRYTRAYCDEIWSEWKEEKETYTKEEIDKIFEIGKITGGAGAVFDELPIDTFTGYPENPDPETYLWEMKCTHYNHHMIFYFDTDPSGKIGIVEKDSGSLGFKLLDSAFTYKKYKGYFRKATSNSGSWTAFTNDNHFNATSSRDINAIYYYNFDIMNGNNPEEVYLYGNPGITEDAITDFNKAIECKEYIVDIKPGTTALNSPEEPSIKGILKVSSVEGIVHQTLETSTGKTYKRMFNNSWSEWKTLGDTDTPKIGTLTADTTTVTENVETDFNNAHKCSMYNVRQVTNTIPNSPMTGAMYGVLKVSNVKALIHQTLETTEGRTFKRMLNGTWTAWKEEVKKNEIENLLTSVPNKINTYTYTNADGMPEVYKWFDINGLKIMWIDVKLSESEYNSGSSGAMMKTLNFPAEAQIFNSIIMANITSYNRSGNDTLSRVVQNAEIISNVSVRGRWRHTDNTYPRIDRFTIMCLGI